MMNVRSGRISQFQSAGRGARFRVAVMSALEESGARRQFVIQAAT
jgi:hypothetical protein